MSIIKQCFTSRSPNGYLIEADFSQLEVIGLAVLSGDDQLKQDIRDGVDLHCQSVSFMTGDGYDHIWYMVHEAKDPTWIKKRKEAKAVSFN